MPRYVVENLCCGDGKSITLIYCNTRQDSHHEDIPILCNTSCVDPRTSELIKQLKVRKAQKAVTEAGNNILTSG
jgi:hypothetical protein